MQKQLKERKLKQEKEIEKAWIEEEMRQMDQYDEMTRKKLEEQYKKKMNNSRVVRQQLHSAKVNHMRQMREHQIEGEFIKREAAELLEKER